MSELLKRLKQDGNDVDGALDRFVGEEEIYESCIDLFMNDENFDILKTAVNQKDTKNGFECAHNLKGVSANLGFVKLTEAICELVEIFRAGKVEGSEEAYQKILDEYNRLLEIVGKIIE